MTEINVRKTAINIAYDGTNYAGWQRQNIETTVQGTIESCLSTLFNRQTTLHGSGRTDAGVHALAQVAHFDRPEKFHSDKLFNAMNALLPDDIEILSISPVDEDFHSRFSVISKTYTYVLNINDNPSPFSARYSWHYTYNLDMELIRKALELLKGQHDFYYFTTPSAGEYSSVREIFSTSVGLVDGYIRINITGSGFLRYMVRAIIGTVLKTGRGDISVDKFESALQRKPIEPLPITLKAPANGLYLHDVKYDNDIFNSDARNRVFFFIPEF